MARDWTLDPDIIVALPVDDLALRVLVDARDNNEWNWRNWVLLAQQAYQRRPDAVQALVEAWTWLINRGLVIRDPNQTSTESITVSRQGHDALERGLPWLRAVQRLDLELQPELEARARPQFLRGDFEAAALLAMKEVEVRGVRCPTSAITSSVAPSPRRRSRQERKAGKLQDRSHRRTSKSARQPQSWSSSRARLAPSRTPRAIDGSTIRTRRRRQRSYYSPTYCSDCLPSCGRLNSDRGRSSRRAALVRGTREPGPMAFSTRPVPRDRTKRY